MATLENVQAKIARLQAQAAALAAKQSSGVIAKIRDLMEKHGLTVADIEAHIGAKKRGRKPGAATVAKPAASAQSLTGPAYRVVPWCFGMRSSRNAACFMGARIMN